MREIPVWKSNIEKPNWSKDIETLLSVVSCRTKIKFLIICGVCKTLVRFKGLCLWDVGKVVWPDPWIGIPYPRPTISF